MDQKVFTLYQLLPLVSRVLAGETADKEIIQGPPQMFGELNESLGAYVVAPQMDEQKRSICPLLSVIWLRDDRYTTFTCK